MKGLGLDPSRNILRKWQRSGSRAPDVYFRALRASVMPSLVWLGDSKTKRPTAPLRGKVGPAQNKLSTSVGIERVARYQNVSLVPNCN
jgi:hypothetical protein